MPAFLVAPGYRVQWANRRALEQARGVQGTQGVPLPAAPCYRLFYGRDEPCGVPQAPCRLELPERPPVSLPAGQGQAGERLFWHRSDAPAPRALVGRLVACPDQAGLSPCWLELVEDRTPQLMAEMARDRQAALLRAIRRVDAALIAERPAREVLEAVADGVLELGFSLCWVGLKESDYTVRPVVSRGLAADYVAHIRVRWDASPEGMGPTGRAVRTGVPVVCPDTETDPSFAPWREQAVRRGYRSSIAVPMVAEGEVLGALNVYSQTPNAFDEQAVEALQTLARQATLALLAARRWEQALEAERRFRSLAETASEAILMVRLDGRVVYANPAAGRHFGSSPSELVDLHAAELLGEWPLPVGLWQGWGLRRDGGRVALEGSVHPIHTADGPLYTLVLRQAPAPSARGR